MSETPDEARRRAANGESDYRRGEVAAKTENRFRDAERRLAALESSGVESELRGLRAEVREVAEAFKTATAVAAARAADSVSTRTFLVSLAVVLLMLAALIVGTKH